MHIMDRTNFCLSPAEIEERLRSVSIQPTMQRISICRYVLCQADHPTAEEVKDWVDKNFFKMSLATVYNTLNLLVSAGLLREYRFAKLGKSVYDSNTMEHYHFFDENSGKLFDIGPDSLKIESNLPEGYEVNRKDVLLTGKIDPARVPEYQM